MPGVSATEVVIGQSITLQGGENAYGAAVHQGARMYIDQVNAAGGVHGRKLVLRTLDYDNKSNVAEANARKLVDDGAFLLFSSVEGGPSTAIVKVAQAPGCRSSARWRVRPACVGLTSHWSIRCAPNTATSSRPS